MRKLNVLLMYLLACQIIYSVPLQRGREDMTKTSSIRGLPFCILVLREFVRETSDEDKQIRELHVLIEPDNISEANLTNLFKALSAKYPAPQSMEVLVYTDVEQLKRLATGIGESGDESSIKQHQSAYYTRTKQVELFRYNPNFPESGMKTVILRGKE